MNEKPKTIRDRVNECAADLARTMGWKFEPDLDFSTDTRPQVQQFWSAACAAYESLMGDRPDLNAEVEEDVVVVVARAAGRNLSDAEKSHLVNLAHAAQSAAQRAKEAAEYAELRAGDAKVAADKLTAFTLRLVEGKSTDDLLPARMRGG